MSDIKLGTLSKIEYNSLPEFVDLINRNFAVIQNSPMFRGIPGDKGDSIKGDSGERGSKLIFLDNKSFAESFGLTDTLTLSDLNTLLKDTANNRKLLSILRVDKLVDGDTLILPSNLILYFDKYKNQFVNTYRTINNSPESTKDNIIRELKDQLFSELLSVIDTPIVKYNTIKKLKSDHNSNTTPIADNLGFYSPVIKGITSTDGTEIDDHNYYGFKYNRSDIMSSSTKKNTFVLGDIIDFYNILHRTVSTEIRSGKSFTEQYSITKNNIPSLVVLQNDSNNGILLGSTRANTLNNLVHIFQSNDGLNIKTKYGNVDSDKVSMLRILSDGLYWNNKVEISGLTKIKNNLEITGNINNDNFTTGKYSVLVNDYLNRLGLSETDEVFQTIIGSVHANSNLLLGSETIKLENSGFYATKENSILKPKVLTTDEIGRIQKSHYKSVAGLYTPGVKSSVITKLPGTESELKNDFITAYHYNNLVDHFNLLYSTGVDGGLYWFKKEWETGVIPSLKLNNTLEVDSTVKFGGDKIRFSKENDSFGISTLNTTLSSTNINLPKFINKVLYTDNSGKLMNDLSIDLNFNIATGLKHVPDSNTDEYPTFSELITGKHFKYLNDHIKNDVDNLRDNYWRKEQYKTGVIPNLRVADTIGANNRFVILRDDSIDLNNNTTIWDNQWSVYMNKNDVKFAVNQVNLNAPIIQTGKLPNIEDNNVVGFGSIDGNKGYLKGIIKLNEVDLASDPRLNENYFANGLTIKSILSKLNDLREYVNTYVNQQINNLTQLLNSTINNSLNPLINRVNNIEDQVNINKQNINRIGLSDTPGTNTIVEIHRRDLNSLSERSEINKTLLDQLRSEFNNYKNEINLWKHETNNKVKELEVFKRETVQLPRGAIILWEGNFGTTSSPNISPFNIPDGWEEVQSLKSRFPVGLHANFDEFKHLTLDVLQAWDTTEGDNILQSQWVNGYGGAMYHKLTENQMPRHKHNHYWSIGSGGASGRNGSLVEGWRETSETGGDQKHNNLPPYKVVMFLRSLKGIEPKRSLIEDTENRLTLNGIGIINTGLSYNANLLGAEARTTHSSLAMAFDNLRIQKPSGVVNFNVLNLPDSNDLVKVLRIQYKSPSSGEWQNIMDYNSVSNASNLTQLASIQNSSQNSLVFNIVQYPLQAYYFNKLSGIGLDSMIGKTMRIYVEYLDADTQLNKYIVSNEVVVADRNNQAPQLSNELVIDINIGTYDSKSVNAWSYLDLGTAINTNDGTSGINKPTTRFEDPTDMVEYKPVTITHGYGLVFNNAPKIIENFGGFSQYLTTQKYNDYNFRNLKLQAINSQGIMYSSTFNLTTFPEDRWKDVFTLNDVIDNLKAGTTPDWFNPNGLDGETSKHIPNLNFLEFLETAFPNAGVKKEPVSFGITHTNGNRIISIGYNGSFHENFVFRWIVEYTKDGVNKLLVTDKFLMYSLNRFLIM